MRSSSVDLHSPERYLQLRVLANFQRYTGCQASRNFFDRYMRIRKLDDALFLALMGYTDPCVKDIDISPSPLANQLLLNITEELTPSNILVAFHLGLFRALPSWLCRYGAKLCIPVTNNVYREYEELREKKKRGTIRWSGDFLYVDIEDPRGIRKLIEYMHNGYTLLMYLDGNSGIGGMARHDSKMQRLSFMSKELDVRVGLSWFATRYQLQPILLFNTLLDHTMRIEAKPLSQADNFVEEAWHLIASEIRKYPEQWECWAYVNEFEPLSHEEPLSFTLDPDRQVRFNKDRYDFYFEDDVPYLFDKEKAKESPISKPLFSLLSHAQSEESPQNSFLLSELLAYGKPSLWKDLLGLEVLQYV